MTEIIKIQSLIQSKKARACQCTKRRLEVDPENRIVICLECGQYIDPITALCMMSDRMSEQAKELNRLNSLKKDLLDWINKNRHFRVIKYIEEQYKGGNHLPSCPHCKKYFDLSDLVSWANKRWIKE